MTLGQVGRKIIFAIVLMIMAVLVGQIIWRFGRGGSLTVPIGRDLLAYWGSSTLLLRRQDPYDLEALLDLQQRQGWSGGEPVVAWNPPLLHVLLLPLAAVSLPTAGTVWLILNTLLIGLGASWAWWSISTGSRRLAPMYVPILAFSFASSANTILEGQVTALVLLGLSGFLMLRAQNREFLAGACCVLMAVKPHLVYLLLPLLLIHATLKRQWSMLAGFVVTLLGLLAVATFLYPTWPVSYLRVFQSPLSPMRHQYITPTVSGLLYVCFKTTLGRYLWLPLLPLAIWLFLRYGRALDSRTLLNWALMAGLVTTPFAWASDQVVLLVPILEVVARAMNYSSLKRLWIFAILGVVFLYAWWFWVVNYQEVPRLVVPFAVAALYGYSSSATPRRLRSALF